MTSLPPQRQQQPSQQRPSSPEASSSRHHRRSSIPQSATSEDSQTVLLNHPSSSESSPKPEPRPRQQASPKVQTAESDWEPRKCWICFADETEDTPTTSEWRSPCPCSLTAHESCLLDFVADLEAPQNRKSTGLPKIECPQCKAKITIARPRSLVVEGVRALQRVTARFILPFTFVTLYVHFGLCSLYSARILELQGMLREQMARLQHHSLLFSIGTGLEVKLTVKQGWNGSHRMLDARV